MKNKILLATALSLLGTAAFAQATAVQFNSGDNGGALKVAQSKYGRSQALSTAIVDIDDDGNAEIAVRFDESCSSDRCDHALLYFSGSRWQEVLETRTSYLAVSREQQQGVRHLLQDHNVRWSWMNGVYEPSPAEVTNLEEISEPSGALARYEAADTDVRRLTKVTRELADLTGDGATESVVKSRIIPDCTGTNICPVLVFDESGKKIGDFYSEAAQIGLFGDELYTFGRYGFSSYAFDGQTYSHKETFMSLAAPGK
ncbi:hypothetical protein [Salipiger sp. PrR003]|uniref:hypothetical protein n=1 Tax=Salipiger sp. PrR003 TaxID=2706776 RepID=UPI0013DCF93C|nr:hypothetical protein [Salipiger sp. PrR003]NDV52782.1 hypothetical protein [Salipiger sp. PrR003]